MEKYLKKNEVVFKEMTSSQRIAEPTEIVELIDSSSGITRKSLQRIIGNSMRNLAKMEKSKLVKSELLSEISYSAPSKVYYSRTLSVKNILNIELASFGIYALRQRRLKIGRIKIQEGGNLSGNAVIDEEKYSCLEFITLTAADVDRKVSQMKNEKRVQKVLIFEGRDLFSKVAKKYENQFDDSILLVVQKLNNLTVIEMIILKEKKLHKITEDFNFKDYLITSKNRREVERIEESYRKADIARLRSLNNFKK